MDQQRTALDIPALTQALRAVLEEMNQPPFGLYVDIEDVDYDAPAWTVSVSQFTATISGDEMAAAQRSGLDLGLAMKNLVFEKFQWLISEV